MASIKARAVSAIRCNPSISIFAYTGIPLSLIDC
jgi:hypothetical protein